MTARSVALLSLFTRTDTFVGDEGVASAAATLEAHGYKVHVLRRARDRDTDDEFHAAITKWVAATGCDLAVLVRAWDGGAVEAVRRGVRPGVQVVRLAPTTAAAIDETFDAVVSQEGLLALIEGRAPIGPRLPKTADLRALPLAPAAAELAHSEGSRPTVRGPMVGCPFLLDARKQSMFAALSDVAGLQTKGCTFCLDNVGAYVAPPAEEVVATWLSQLRAIRAKSKHAREVLLVDERPHPYLPSLFRAIAEEPELAELEVMIKSRVDWLLEFESELVAAIEAARASRSTLHLYLVGFESFDPFHLALFNKGVTVADNVAAIAKMRELGTRFPDAFEYRKYRAHGIVLFTPWTTPESLRINAATMRNVRFSELRTESLRTRLRLYPRTPLHALAARDGLLCDEAPDGRTDRAAEQGYDASTPWRFADRRVEAIFRAATDVHAAARTLDESDVLEAAIELVEQYPGLADAPGVAALPLLQTIEEQRALRGLPRLGRMSVPSVRRARVDGPSLVTAYRAMGLAAAVDGDLVRVAPDDAGLRSLAAASRPALPSALSAGAPLGPHRIGRIVADGDSHRLVIDDLEVRVRGYDAARSHVLRYGRFAIDVDEPLTLDDRQKDALRHIVTVLARQ